MGRGRGEADYLEVAEAAWRWVLDQVRYDDEGPWIPEAVTDPPVEAAATDRDCMYCGIGGLVYVLAEIGRTRGWTAEETELAGDIQRRVAAVVTTTSEPSYFEGLVSHIGVLAALDPTAAAPAVARLAALATDDGWPSSMFGPPRARPGARINELGYGTTGVLMGAVWAARLDVTGARELAGTAADVLLAEAEPTDTGLDWGFLPRRFAVDERVETPNFSHGLAGTVAALAAAASTLERPDLLGAARQGAEQLVAIGDASDDGFVVPVRIPARDDQEAVTFSWCHGPTGTLHAFAALDRAGVPEIGGRSPRDWHRRCLHSLRTSGLPARLRPGFWDNDGRCCGTAGVGEAFLDAYAAGAEPGDLEFARVCADAVLDRVQRDGDLACWRFVEHRNEDPLLPPGVGWMQGAAGIAAYLFRLARVLDHESDPTVDATPVPRMDTWWLTDR